MQDNIITFSKYGKTFQERVVQALLLDHKWAEEIQEILNPKYFDLKYLGFIAKLCFDYAKKYRTFPTFPLLVGIVKDELSHAADEILKQQVVEFLTKIRSDDELGDIPFVKEKALDFCRKAALKDAIEQSIDLMNAENSYESIAEIVKKAVSMGVRSTTGHDFLNEPDARFVTRNRNPVPTGIEKLDSKGILNGGLGRGELGCIVAGTGVGKSHFLTQIGANAMRAGKNVIHYTLEMSESLVGLRYDSNLCDIDSNDVHSKKDDVIGHYATVKLGRLFIKEFPTCWATITNIRSHVEKLAAIGFKPDLILIDYADIMRSTRQYDAKRFELQQIYQELRAFASEICVPIWTASQSNKEGSNADVVDLSNMSEAYSKAQESDVVISLSRKSHEKAAGVGRLFVAKNRIGSDGLLYSVKINTARSMITLLSDNPDAVSSSSFDPDNEEDTRIKLRNRLKELQTVEELKGIN